MNDDVEPEAVRAPRRRGGRAKGQGGLQLLPAERGQAQTRVGATQLAAAPLRPGRRHPSIGYAMLKRVLSELQNAGGYIDQLVLHMEKSNLPETPELRATQRMNRQAIAAVLERLNGTPE